MREETGLELRIGELEGSWLTDVELRDVTVESPGADGPLRTVHSDGGRML